MNEHLTPFTGEKRIKINLPHKTPLQAIRAKCMDCSNYQPKEVRFCTVPDCALYPYRMGKRPKAEEDELQ